MDMALFDFYASTPERFYVKVNESFFRDRRTWYIRKLVLPV